MVSPEFRGHERTGRPLGSPEFVAEAERDLGRRLQAQRPGRKRKPKYVWCPQIGQIGRRREGRGRVSGPVTARRGVIGWQIGSLNRFSRRLHAVVGGGVQETQGDVLPA